MLKKCLLTVCLGVSLAAQAQPTDSERIAALERQVARLTEQLNHLLAERAQFAPVREPQTVYVCRLKAFTDTFRSESSSRGRAKLDVLKQCHAKHNEMFCKAEQISCEAYR